MLAETLTAKERESLEDKEETLGNGEKDKQQEKEKEVTEEKEPQGGGIGGKDEEEELEELRAQMFQLLLELDEAREVSQRHEESFLELQGQFTTALLHFSTSSPSIPQTSSQQCFLTYSVSQLLVADKTSSRVFRAEHVLLL